MSLWCTPKRHARTSSVYQQPPPKLHHEGGERNPGWCEFQPISSQRGRYGGETRKGSLLPLWPSSFSGSTNWTYRQAV